MSNKPITKSGTIPKKPPRPPESPGWSSPEKDYNPERYRDVPKPPPAPDLPTRDTSRKSFDTGDSFLRRIFNRLGK